MSPTSDKPALFTCTSIENNWPHRGARFADVHVTWFVHSKRPEGYAEKIGTLRDPTDVYSRARIEEVFTADEALRFAAYLKEAHGSTVNIEPLEHRPENDGPYGAIAVGGMTDFHMLSSYPGYSLPFEVWGYYNVENARLVESAKEGDRDVILRRNNDQTRNSCARCDVGDRMDVPLAASLEGSERWVCLDCFEKHIGVPGAARLIDYLNGFLAERRLSPEENRESFLCNLDSVLDTAVRRLEKDASTASRASRLQQIASELAQFAAELNAGLSPKYQTAMAFAYGATESDSHNDSDLPF